MPKFNLSDQLKRDRDSVSEWVSKRDCTCMYKAVNLVVECNWFKQSKPLWMFFVNKAIPLVIEEVEGKEEGYTSRLNERERKDSKIRQWVNGGREWWMQKSTIEWRIMLSGGLIKCHLSDLTLS